MTLAPRRGTRAWRTLRAAWQARIDANNGWTCRRTGQPIPPHQPKAWDLGHKTPRHNGGTNNPTNTHPEHTTCNRSAGGKTGATITNQPPPLKTHQL